MVWIIPPLDGNTCRIFKEFKWLQENVLNTPTFMSTCLFKIWGGGGYNFNSSILKLTWDPTEVPLKKNNCESRALSICCWDVLRCCLIPWTAVAVLSNRKCWQLSSVDALWETLRWVLWHSKHTTTQRRHLVTGLHTLCKLCYCSFKSEWCMERRRVGQRE